MIVDDETNCITDYADEARSWSMALREVPSEEMGPLHGLPISVKESFYVQGHDATAGLTKFINRPAEKDCSLIKVRLINKILELMSTYYNQCQFLF